LKKTWANFVQIWGKIWVKVIKWANLIRYGQNQNLASPHFCKILSIFLSLFEKKNIYISKIGWNSTIFSG